MAKHAPLAVTVRTTIPASANAVYELVSDITRMAEFSPETVAATWLGGADRAVAGAKFKGTNAIGKLRWSTKPTVTAADPGRRFSFKVPGRFGATWVYLFESVDDGTLVTEQMWQDRPSPLPIRILQRRAGVTDRAEHLRQGMALTLDRLSAAATAGTPAAVTTR